MEQLLAVLTQETQQHQLQLLSKSLTPAIVSELITSLLALIIIIIGHYAPILRILSENFSADNVTVTVEWTHQPYATYRVTVVPAVSIVITGSTRRQLTIPYNTEYTLTVEATAPCRPNTTALIRLKYGEES